MSKSNHLFYGCKLIAIVMLLSIVGYVYLSAIGGSLPTRSENIFLVLFCLNVLSCIGLFFIKRWAFWLSYFNILVATYFEVFIYLIFIPYFLAELKYRRYFDLIALGSNLLVLAYIIYLHYLYKQLKK